MSVNHIERMTKVVTWLTSVKAELKKKYPNVGRLDYLMRNQPSNEDKRCLSSEPELRVEYQKTLRRLGTV